MLRVSWNVYKCPGVYPRVMEAWWGIKVTWNGGVWRKSAGHESDSEIPILFWVSLQIYLLTI